MAPLTDGQLNALRNLADKHAGAETAFLNISHARQLTELGLAQRSRQGWEITPAGTALLAGLDPPERPDASIGALHPPGGEEPEG
jgi:hypothetical protein